MTACFCEFHSKAFAALRIRPILDAAILLVVSVRAALLRIIGLFA